MLVGTQVGEAVLVYLIDMAIAEAGNALETRKS
jgi:hypothetical protein